MGSAVYSAQFTDRQYIDVYLDNLQSTIDGLPGLKENNDTYMIDQYVKEEIPEMVAEINKYTSSKDWTAADTKRFDKLKAEAKKWGWDGSTSSVSETSVLDAFSLDSLGLGGLFGGGSKKTSAKKESDKSSTESKNEASVGGFFSGNNEKGINFTDYGAGIKNGANIINVGVGVSATPFILQTSQLVTYYLLGAKKGDLKSYFVPTISLGYERSVHLLNKLPFTFGGFVSIAACGFNGQYGSGINDYSASQGNNYDYVTPVKNDCFFTNFGATAKYHINIAKLSKFDFFGGVKLGLYISSISKCTFEQGGDLGNAVTGMGGYKKDKNGNFIVADKNTTTKAQFYWDITVGATYFFTERIGVTLETGFPEFIMLSANIKF